MGTRLHTRLSKNRPILLVFGLAILLFIGASIARPGFSHWTHVEYIILTATVLGLPAAGQTIVIIGGGIDLSVPWVMTSSAVLTAAMSGGQTSKLVWVIPVVFGIAAVVGLVNGIGVGVMGLSPIVMTLATNVVLSGIIPLEVQLSSSAVSPRGITNLASGHLLGIPIPLIILVVAGAIVTVLLTWTPLGRRTYAVGANTLASRLSGVHTRWVTAATYVFSALGAAAGGLLLLGFVGSAYPGMADQYQFSTIAAVVVGGASILGGSGNYLGTIAGVFLLTVLNALLAVYSLGSGIILMLYGAIILVSVWIAQQDFGTRLRSTQRES
jgi:ribose transport system permease protein